MENSVSDKLNLRRIFLREHCAITTPMLVVVITEPAGRNAFKGKTTTEPWESGEYATK
jgi:hypothetical protein